MKQTRQNNSFVRGERQLALYQPTILRMSISEQTTSVKQFPGTGPIRFRFRHRGPAGYHIGYGVRFDEGVFYPQRSGGVEICLKLSCCGFTENQAKVGDDAS